MKPIKVLLVDDHQVAREGLRRMLELDKGIEVVGEAASGEEALTQAPQLSPDIVLMDMKMPGMGGIEAIRQLKAMQPSINIIVLTVYEDQYLAQAAKAGAIGYLLKDTGREELIQAIRAAHLGHSPLSPSITRRLLTEYASLAEAGQSYAPTPRQLEILQLIAAGATNREIASKLFLSEATVKRETSSIFTKLDVSDRAQAVSEGYKRNLL